MASNCDPTSSRTLGVLHSLRGMVIISSYPSPLYQRLYHEWRRIEWTSGHYCTTNEGAESRTEVVWMNPAAVARSPQGRLFAGDQQSQS